MITYCGRKFFIVRFTLRLFTQGLNWLIGKWDNCQGNCFRLFTWQIKRNALLRSLESMEIIYSILKIISIRIYISPSSWLLPITFWYCLMFFQEEEENLFQTEPSSCLFYVRILKGRWKMIPEEKLLFPHQTARLVISVWRGKTFSGKMN